MKRLLQRVNYKICTAVLILLVSIGMAVNGYHRVAQKNRPPKTYADVLIALDAGHGGSQAGAIYFDALEKDINLAVVLLTTKELDKYGFKVLLTRRLDGGVTLDHRVVLANSCDADLFVSVHSNAYPEDDTIQGIEAYYNHEDDSSQELALSIALNTSEQTGADVRSVVQKSSGMMVITDTWMPAILLEMGYMTNKQECAKLNDPDYQLLMAQGIANGIREYVDQYILAEVR